MELGTAVERANDFTIGRTLEVPALKPHRRHACALTPPKAKSAFAAGTEDAHSVHTPPCAPDRAAGVPGPDLKPPHRRDAHAHRHEPRTPRRVDHEYERNGTANLFMLFAPLEGWRHVEVNGIVIPP